MSDQIPVFACTLRRGGDFHPGHVKALWLGVQTWWPVGVPLRFICFTDWPIHHRGVEERPLPRDAAPGWWSKLYACAPDHWDLGPMLHADLDTVIVGDLSPLVTQAQYGTATLLTDFYKPDRTQTGLWALDVESRAVIWSAWKNGEAMRTFRGDGEFVDSVLRPVAARWQSVLPGMIVSFKSHVRQRPGQQPPPEARVVCFHGRPRPWDTKLFIPHTTTVAPRNG